MKKIFLITIWFVQCLASASQENDRIAMLGYYGQYVQGYFENILAHQYYDKLTGYNTDSYITMTFNIDTKGAIKNLSIQQNGIPDSLVFFVRNILLKSDQAWTPQIKNCQMVLSDTITCYFLFKNKHEITKLLPKLDLSPQQPDKGSEIFTNFGKKNYCFVFLKL